MRLTSLVLLGILVLCAAGVVSLSPHGFAMQDRFAISSTATRTYLAGTDELGRDRAVRLSVALLMGLGGACLASLLSSALSVALGAMATFGARWLRLALLYAGDLFLTLPWLFLLMLVRSSLPLNLAPARSAAVTFLLLALLGAPAYLRIQHERSSSLRRTDWLFQAQAAGLRPPQLLRHILPHLRPLFWTQFLLYVPACLIAEANLGTLGLGVQEPLPSLGNFVATLQSAALLGGSRLVYVPLLVLVFMLVILELTIFGVHD